MSMGQGEGNLSELLDLLARSERRCLLYYLREHEEASIETLTDLLAGWRAAGREGTAVDTQRVRTRLVHAHLPKLSNQGLVEYDESAGDVELETLPDLADRLLDLTLEVDGSGSQVEAIESL